jgi:3-oxoacyl-[acyl-carrier protein] reductase
VTVTVDLAGRVALVTGGSRGIGRAIALRFAAAGADVAVLATSAAKAEPVAAEARKAGVRALAIGADVADAGAAGEAVERVLSELGGLHVVVNNAGITRDMLLLRMTEEDFDRVLAVNLKGAFNVCRAAARPLAKARGGRIINVTSVVGMTGNAGQANYAAAKAGLVGLTKSLAKELGGRGVTVNAIAPGFITTDMTDNLPAEVKDATMKAIPLARFGAPEDVGNAALYLASDLGSYVTGHVLVVAGGLAM